MSNQKNIKFFFIYKTTNIITKKIYIGKHETYDLNDGYLGSGKVLISSMKKHGRVNFVREILEFVTQSNVFEKEIFWISKLNAIKEGYNLSKGGRGGNGREIEFWTKEQRLNASIKMKGRFAGNNNHFFGKKHTKETKNKILKTFKENGKTKKEKHPRWVNFDEEKLIQLYESALTKEELANMLNITLGTLDRRIDYLGLPKRKKIMRPQQGSKNRNYKILDNELITEMYDAGNSIKTIALFFKCSINIIRNRLRK